jgi:hypothetical protein
MILKYTYIQWMLISHFCQMQEAADVIENALDNEQQKVGRDRMTDDHEISIEVNNEEWVSDINDTATELENELHAEGCQGQREGSAETGIGCIGCSTCKKA